MLLLDHAQVSGVETALKPGMQNNPARVTVAEMPPYLWVSRDS